MLLLTADVCSGSALDAKTYRHYLRRQDRELAMGTSLGHQQLPSRDLGKQLAFNC